MRTWLLGAVMAGMYRRSPPSATGISSGYMARVQSGCLPKVLCGVNHRVSMVRIGGCHNVLRRHQNIVTGWGISQDGGRGSVVEYQTSWSAMPKPDNSADAASSTSVRVERAESGVGKKSKMLQKYLNVTVSS